MWKASLYNAVGQRRAPRMEPSGVFTHQKMGRIKQEKGRDRQEAESPRERGKPRKEFERMSNADVRDDLRFYHVSTSVEPHKGRLRRGRGERSAAVDGPGENSLTMQPQASRFQQHADLFKAVTLCALCM